VRSVFQRAFEGVRRGERGITGLETAIILIAFVVVATVFAFIVLTTGIFSAERGKETVFAGLQKARGTMEVRGGVIVTATGTPLAVTTIQFAVATAAGGDPIPLDPAATSLRTVIAYRDADTYDHDVPYTVNFVVGDGDFLVEPGELAVVTVAIADINPGGAAPTAPPVLTANSRWTLEIQTPVGATIDLTRSMPGEIDTVMQLH
jgi:flagellin FlaB